jgi:UDP-N-acetylmuramoylalanine--D-glutamate ligase
MFDAILSRLKGKKLLILGFGREGKSSLRFLRKHLADEKIGIADANPKAFETVEHKNLVFHSGESYLDAIYDYDIVIKTPGISLKDFDTKDIVITSQTDLFLRMFHSQTIGVTGTKGKSTTSSLIFHLLESVGRDCILTGNIGIPCFDVIEDIKSETIIVYELSAHQLEYVHNSPKVGVLLNVFEEHLDHFGTFERYKNAKLNLLRFMGDKDYAVIHDSLMNDAFDLFVNQIVFSLMDFEIDTEALPIFGEHNLLNVRAALCACSAYGIEIHEIIPYLYTFKPLEHRLEKVGTFGGVSFFNDSISTIPQACIAACVTLGKVDFLLLGGFDREIDYQPLANFLQKSKIPHLLFTGKAGQRVHELLKAQQYAGWCADYSNMEEAFVILSDKAQQGDVCLLSPAAASYDQYKNFEEEETSLRR